MEADPDVGPMITDKAVARAAAMFNRAVQAGAMLICCHQPSGNLYPPTVLENGPVTCDAWSEEVFAPIVILEPFDTLHGAIALANSPDYSLHAGIFTNDLEDALDAADLIEVGGVIINGSSDYRFDAMSFGGFKCGSMGREGVRFCKEFNLLSGEDGTVLGYMAHGGHGCISVTSNIAPRLCADFQHPCLEGDFNRALELQDQLISLHQALFL